MKQIDTGIQRYIDQDLLAGVVTLLAQREQVTHAGCYGYMDLTHQKPMQPDTIFRIFSMTKPVTSLAVLMLREEGHFDLQTPVAQFIPAFKDMQVLIQHAGSAFELMPLERPITIHHLLTHTSGLGYGLDANLPVDALFVKAEILRTDETLADKMARIATLPLHHQPGERFTYSIATDVLGYLVELVSGMPLDAFFKNRIFEPLGMVDTGFYVPPDKLSRLAVLYTPGPSGSLVNVAALPRDMRPQFLRDAWVDKGEKPHFLSGGGGLVSTAADYLRFALMLANKGSLDGQRLVSLKTIALMTAPHLSPEQFLIPGCSSGLGLTVLIDPVLAKIPGSAGAFGGGGAASTDFWVDPSLELVGVLMTQYVAPNGSSVNMEYKSLAVQAIDAFTT